jgi:hypothetical protein
VRVTQVVAQHLAARLPAAAVQRFQIPGAGWQSWPLHTSPRVAVPLPPHVLTGDRRRR